MDSPNEMDTTNPGTPAVQQLQLTVPVPTVESSRPTPSPPIVASPNPQLGQLRPPVNETLSQNSAPNAPLFSASGSELPLTIRPDEDDDADLYSGLFDIEQTPALRMIEQIKKNRDLPVEKIEDLRQRFLSLHSHLLSSIKYERSLHQTTNRISRKVASQKVDADRSTARSFQESSGIGELKRELTKAQNEVALCLEREARLEKEIEDTQREKTQLLSDIEGIRRHKQDMLEPQLIQSTKELKLEVLQRRHQVENLQKDLEEKEGTCATISHERELLEADRERHAAALTKSAEMPLKIQKQSAVLIDALSSLGSELNAQTNQSGQLEQSLANLQKRKRELEDTKLDLLADVETRKGEARELEKACEDITKDLEIAKEQVVTQRAEKVRLEAAGKRIIQEAKREHDRLLRSLRDKDTALKLNRRLTNSLNALLAAIPPVKNHLVDLDHDANSCARERAHRAQEQIAARRETDILLHHVVKTKGVDEEKRTLVESEQEKIANLETELDRATKELSGTRTRLVSVSLERTLRARDLLRAQARLRRAREDLAATIASLTDAQESCEEAMHNVHEFAAMYEVVKAERNRYAEMVRSAGQRCQEVEEKLKVLGNEAEVVKGEVETKERELGKQKRENAAAYALRDTMRNEANKAQAIFDQIAQHVSRIATLTTRISSAEAVISTASKTLSRYVCERDGLAANVSDRNRDLKECREKLEAMQDYIRNGEEAGMQVEEDISKIRTALKGIERSIQVGHKFRVETEELERRAEQITGELQEVRKRVDVLGDTVETPTGEQAKERVRHLGGKDPSQQELSKRIRFLEEKLAETEEKLLEKDLVLEEVEDLVGRVEADVEDGKSVTGSIVVKVIDSILIVQGKKGSPDLRPLHMQVNELQRRIKAMTRSVTSCVSELSMHQALAMTLYRELCDKEALITEARTRVDRGEAPTPEVEVEYVKAERRRVSKEQELREIEEKRRKETSAGVVEVDDDGFFVISATTRTLAEPRPNAYVTDAITIGSSGISELPIPKPYGAYAPFKPVDVGTGSHLQRYYRKPINQPVEI
ncbi:hypothetical protein HDU93_003009 [Gonapodya sp. JEL0774]|nr:hypothetical protein HDU93_003009 [Gonapodya sp. JEL0774]